MFKLCQHVVVVAVVLPLSAGAVSKAVHEGNEAAVGARLTQERVLQQLKGGGTLGGVTHQHALYEALETG